MPSGTYKASLLLYDEENTSAEMVLGQVHITRPSLPPDIPDAMTRIPASASTSPLELVAMSVSQNPVKPCEELHGKLFWEVTEHPHQVLLQGSYSVHFQLGNVQHQAPVTPDFDPEDWQVGDRFLSNFRLPIPCRALDTHTPINITLHAPKSNAPLATWQGMEAQIHLGRAFSPPDAMRPLEVNVGANFTTLIGYQLEPHPVAANTPFTLTLYWQAKTLTDIPYTVFVHATPPDTPGPVIAQHDSWPGQGTRATYSWVEDEIIADAHPLPGLPAGTYRLRIGLYGPDGVRLSLNADQQTIVDNAFPLPEILEVGEE
jgi:hypothetical protein